MPRTGIDAATLAIINRVALPAAMLLLLVIVKIWPILRLRRRAGAWPMSRAMAPRQRLLAAAIGVLNLGQIAWVTSYAVWGPERLGVRPAPAWIGIAGWLAVIAGCVQMARAQAAMGDAWRMGVSGATVRLVETGPFTRIRHPIYAGWLLTLSGFLLLTPALWSLAGWTAFVLVITMQARTEEAALRSAGFDYGPFARTRGMFWPRLTRKPGAA